MYYAPPPQDRRYPHHMLARIAAKKGALIGFVVSVGYGLLILLVIGIREAAALSEVGRGLLTLFFPICLTAGLPGAGHGRGG